MNLYQKLIEVRKVVPYLQKDTKGYQYVYVKGSTVLGSLMQKMNELNLLLVPQVISHETKLMAIREKGQTVEKPTIDCKMIMSWINADAPEERLDVPFACVGTQDDISKAFGSALTYSERYFLLKFFNIATDTDDPDAHQEKPVEKKKAVVSGDKIIKQLIWDLAGHDKAIYAEKLSQLCGGRELETLTKDEKSAIYKQILAEKKTQTEGVAA